MEPLRKRSELEALEQATDGADSVDVPAAVLCARCGQPECQGCESRPSESGVFIMVPWERLDAPFGKRLFATARATTNDADTFFEHLADGPLAPALAFAIVAELFAAGALFALLAVPFSLVFPDLARACLFDPELRHRAMKAVVVGIPGLALLLVVAHAAQGISVDVGARRNGGRPMRSRALRFGLYAAGWDLIIGPWGALAAGLADGPRAALSVFTRASGLPTRATRAFLKGAYRMEGEPATRALHVSYWGAALATIFAAAAVVGSVLVLMLA